ncbi:hypothetical protein J1614_000046 [Plenodomus biglobosus]|nr:hypothetical protein J1614_000046 [Plenodomus biglobosus]
MPPILSRKRAHSDSPPSEPLPKRGRASKPPKPSPRQTRESIFQTLDAVPTPKRTLSETKALLEQGEDDDSELSEPDSSEDEFENVPLHLDGADKAMRQGQAESGSDESDDDDDWEDALGGHGSHGHQHGPTPVITGDIALTLSAAPATAFESKADGKKGASKTQRHVRNVTHCMHVQCLMYHNLVRNSWIQDDEVQRVLVAAMSPACWRELERYWRDAAISDGPSRLAAPAPPTSRPAQTETETETETKTTVAKAQWKQSGRPGVRLYQSPQPAPAVPRGGKEGPATQGKRSKEPPKNTRNGRDWSAASEPLEPMTPNLSAGDPLLRLLRYLSAYWKAKFNVTAPALRKRGYLSPASLAAELRAWNEDPTHADTFGERIENRAAFRALARSCQGSRDVGQQLFTALLRGLGIEARMVVSLQPVGFGWSQSEQGKPKNLDKLNHAAKVARTSTPLKAAMTTTKNKAIQPVSPKRRVNSSVVQLSDSSDISSVISISSDEEARPMNKSPKTRNYSEELPYPTYWTEAISHLTHTPISVSPLPRTVIASAAAPANFADFYARGAAADRARQVVAYLVAFSSDGTAKDVTTRYLPNQMWPGRTKGFRMPVERIPIHNKRGKVKRYEEWDWVNSLMQPYSRPHSKRQPWDEVEDEGDLVPAQPEKKKTMDEEGGKETLQGYKASTEYVLERHLRREEALRPGAKIVRHFVTGKGDNTKSENVYRREDIVNCKTVESWHKEGRAIREGEQPLKFVKIRAVTVARKREIEERERIEGEKVQQGLYSKAQTDWIIPDPIVDGKIPRNAFGNIDVYVPTMVPSGAVHIPLRGTARICRKLNIDYAEACTGFEFGKQRAVPIITGVVVAEEYEDKVIDAWEIAEADKARKEAEKRAKLALSMWKKFASGLRIIERMKAEYGEDVALPKKKAPKQLPKAKDSEWEVFHKQTDFEGGFLRDNTEPMDGRPQQTSTDEAMAGGFFPSSQDEPVQGDFSIDHGEQEEEVRTEFAAGTYRTPISLTSALQQPARVNSHSNDMVVDDNRDSEEIGDAGSSDPTLRREVAATPSARGRSRGRGAKASVPTTKKCQPSVARSPDERVLQSDLLSVPLTSSASIRTMPKRKAARKSDARIKSHFFAEASDGETDLAEMTDRASPRKASRTRSRGKGKAKGAT